MKHAFFLLIFLSGFILSVQAQEKPNEFETVRVSGDLANGTTILNSLKDPSTQVFTDLQTIFNAHGLTNASATGRLNGLSDRISKAITDAGNGKNTAVILVYRNFSINAANQLNADFESVNTRVYHYQAYGDKLSSYLLATKKVFIIFIDMSDDYFKGIPGDAANQLSNATIKIVYKESSFKQQLKATSTLFAMSGAGKTTPKLTLTLVQMDSTRVKDPCDIVISQKSFKDDLTFTIHERNFAGLQTGVVNSKLALNNFSISGGNLVVTPNDQQKTDWKSNLFAAIEFHAPRDIDNFQPIWKVLFGSNPYPDHKQHKFLHSWLYNVLLDRISAYGGLKISKDPLSNLYAGFNYAITKEFAINLGWTWANQVTPQVTAIGDIGNLSDAIAYAKRKYSGPQFSIGVSFAPTAVIDMLGIKGK